LGEVKGAAHERFPDDELAAEITAREALESISTKVLNGICFIIYITY
jgi:hypothetical protein